MFDLLLKAVQRVGAAEGYYVSGLFECDGYLIKFCGCVFRKILVSEHGKEVEDKR